MCSIRGKEEGEGQGRKKEMLKMWVFTPFLQETKVSLVSYIGHELCTT
jgi:hypothetical protein